MRIDTRSCPHSTMVLALIGLSLGGVLLACDADQSGSIPVDSSQMLVGIESLPDAAPLHSLCAGATPEDPLEAAMSRSGSVVVGTITGVRPTSVSEYVPVDLVVGPESLADQARPISECRGVVRRGFEVVIAPQYVGGGAEFDETGSVVVGFPASLFELFASPPIVDGEYVRWPDAQASGALVPGMEVAVWLIPDSALGLNYLAGWIWEYDAARSTVTLGPGAFCAANPEDAVIPVAALEEFELSHADENAEVHSRAAPIYRYGMVLCDEEISEPGACTIRWEGEEVLDPCPPEQYCGAGGVCVTPPSCEGGCPDDQPCAADGRCDPCYGRSQDCMYFNSNGTRRAR